MTALAFLSFKQSKLDMHMFLLQFDTCWIKGWKFPSMYGSLVLVLSYKVLVCFLFFTAKHEQGPVSLQEQFLNSMVVINLFYCP